VDLKREARERTQASNSLFFSGRPLPLVFFSGVDFLIFALPLYTCELLWFPVGLCLQEGVGKRKSPITMNWYSYKEIKFTMANCKTRAYSKFMLNFKELRTSL
jgi:hypothetical protein